MCVLMIVTSKLFPLGLINARVPSYVYVSPRREGNKGRFSRGDKTKACGCFFPKKKKQHDREKNVARGKKSHVFERRNGDLDSDFDSDMIYWALLKML